MKRCFQIACKIMFFFCLLLLPQACAPAQQAPGVTAAYETSGLIAVHPYTRTIFSTHNF